jgi:hypothetical protein
LLRLPSEAAGNNWCDAISPIVGHKIRHRRFSHCHGGNRANPRSKAGYSAHSDCVRGGVGPGRDRPGRKSGATGRLCHGPVDPDDRSRRQATRTFERGCPRSPPVGDHGQCGQSRLRVGNGRGPGKGPCHYVRNPASPPSRRSRAAERPRGRSRRVPSRRIMTLSL